jgi:hypothetical protein
MQPTASVGVNTKKRDLDHKKTYLGWYDLLGDLRHKFFVQVFSPGPSSLVERVFLGVALNPISLKVDGDSTVRSMLGVLVVLLLHTLVNSFLS